MTETLEQRILSLEKHLAQDPKSPLFAQLASFYLDAGRSQDALSLCDKGLAQYPFFTTGHLVKGKTLLALNMKAEARREFEFVRDMLPMNEAVAKFVADIPASADESLTSAAPSELVSEGVRTIKPKPKAQPLPAEPSPPEQPQQPAEISPPPTAEASAEQQLSQFTQAEAEVPPVVSPPEVSAPAPEPQVESAFAEPTPELTPPLEDTFGLSTPSPTEEAVTAEPFTQGSETTADVFGTVEATPVSEAPVDEGEPFEQYAERKGMELAGSENSLSLDEYLQGGTVQPATSEPPAPISEPSAGEPEEDPFAALRQLTAQEPEQVQPEPEQPASAPAEEPPAQQDQIEDLAQKLQGAKRITPVINFSERSTTPLSESESPTGTGFVTTTLAEIYAKQGWYDDAIKAYKTLAANKPLEREKFEKRIQELEEMKKQAGQ